MFIIRNICRSKINIYIYTYKYTNHIFKCHFIRSIENIFIAKTKNILKETVLSNISQYVYKYISL